MGVQMRKIHLAFAVVLLVGLPVMLTPAASAQISVGISVRIGPPPLRVVAVQPYCPGPGYIWTPGYWAYGPVGYYWVPGAWVMAPQPGLLWTPGYWGFAQGVYVWHRGYWGPHVGFYGGVNYGFGYFGTGFVGGRWSGNRFFYNTAVWRVNTAVIRTTYWDRRGIREDRENRVSYNGGRYGTRAQPSAEDMRYARERRFGATPEQARHEAGARPRGRYNRGFGGPAPGRYRGPQADRQGPGGRRAYGRDNAQARGQRGRGNGKGNRGERKKDGRRGPGRGL